MLSGTPRAGDVTPAMVRRPIAVVVSRFPLITETFILREIEELERQGQPVVLVPLIRERRGVAHREAERWLGSMLHAPFLSAGVMTANLRAMWQDPFRYFSVLAELVAGSAHSLNVLLRTLALFPKTVCLAGRLADLGVRHVHAHFATYPAAAALTIAHLGDATYSFTAHAHDIFVPWRRASLRGKIQQAQFVRTIAENGRQHLLACCGAEVASKIEVIHVGVRPQDYQFDSARSDAHVPTLLCVAALKPYKGLAVLLEACQRLKQAGRRFHCDIVGDGPLRSAIERLRASMGLQGSVVLRGALRQDEVSALLARTDIALAPSIVAPDGQMDGIPVSLMEAMAAARPVVASRLSGVPELVEDGETGFLVEPGNAAELAAAIQRLLDDPALAARMGEHGREKIGREFRLDRCVSALLGRLDVYNVPPDQPIPGGWRDAVQSLVPGHDVGIRRAHRRPDSTVLELLVSDGTTARDLILKIHGARQGDRRSAAERAEHELIVLRRLQAMAESGAVGSPGFAYAVPRVLGRAGTALLIEWCGGTLLVEQARKARLGGRTRRAELVEAVRQTGRWLRIFQQHTDHRTDGQWTLQTLVEQAYRDLDACASAGLLTSRERSRVVSRVARLAQLAAVSPPAGSPSVGHHGDFWPGNVLVDGRTIIAIDFEGFRQGLPYEDVAYFLVQLELFFTHPVLARLRKALRAAFLDGYLDGGTIDAAGYEFCRLVKALQIMAGDSKSQRSPSGGGKRRLRALRSMTVRG